MEGIIFYDDLDGVYHNKKTLECNGYLSYNSKDKIQYDDIFKCKVYDENVINHMISIIKKLVIKRDTSFNDYMNIYINDFNIVRTLDNLFDAKTSNHVIKNTFDIISKEEYFKIINENIEKIQDNFNLDTYTTILSITTKGKFSLNTKDTSFNIFSKKYIIYMVEKCKSFVNLYKSLTCIKVKVSDDIERKMFYSVFKLYKTGECYTLKLKRKGKTGLINILTFVKKEVNYLVVGYDYNRVPVNNKLKIELYRFDEDELDTAYDTLDTNYDFRDNLEHTIKVVFE